MARIRTIKPEFFTSEDIVSRSPMARLLYIALWCEADKEGRLVWKPATFKLRYVPGDSCDINALCDELVEAGLVVLYGDGYAYIPTFKAHQHINPRESASQLPDPDDSSTRKSRVGTRQPRVNDATATRREEGKGREGDIHASRTRASVHEFPPGFERVWSVYPRKVGKDAAAKAFAKRKPDAALVDTMVKAIEAQRSSREWQKDGGQFIPHLATWLNGGRWMDDTAQASANDIFAGAM